MFVGLVALFLSGGGDVRGKDVGFCGRVESAGISKFANNERIHIRWILAPLGQF